MKSALILYPHQLFPVDQLPDVQTVVLAEEPIYFGLDTEHHLQIHKHKLILHRASMRRYVEELLWPAGFEVEYVELDAVGTTEDIFERVRKFDKLYIFDPVDDALTQRLLSKRRTDADVPAFEMLQSPNFYLENIEIQQYFDSKHTHVFSEFYQWQRERFNILIGKDYKPVGGTWMFDTIKQQKIEPDETLPSFEVFGDNSFVEEAAAYVNKHFPDNPGGNDFIWPTNHAEAAAWLKDFVTHRIDGMATHQQLLDSQAPWLYHSALSSSLNTGLLSPQQVVTAALERHAKKAIPIESLELFIRQILGVREFVRGQYLVKQAPETGNPLRSHRKMTSAWHTGRTGLLPFDDVVLKLRTRGYATQPERMMIAANLMLIAEIDPSDIRRWFSELFIDSYDWILTPNLSSLENFINTIMVGPIPIAPSKTILQISDYEKGDWTDTWDGLFWRFVDIHRQDLAKHSHTRALVQRLDKLDANRRRIISYRANDFLHDFTQ